MVLNLFEIERRQIVFVFQESDCCRARPARQLPIFIAADYALGLGRIDVGIVKQSQLNFQ